MGVGSGGVYRPTCGWAYHALPREGSSSSPVKPNCLSDASGGNSTTRRGRLPPSGLFYCTPSTRDANRDLVWLRQLDGGAGGGMCETLRGRPLFRGQKVTPANLFFGLPHQGAYLFIYFIFIYFLLLQRRERRHRSQPDAGTCTVFFGGTPGGKVNQAHVPFFPVFRFICLPVVRQADEPRSMKHRR